MAAASKNVNGIRPVRSDVKTYSLLPIEGGSIEREGSFSRLECRTSPTGATSSSAEGGFSPRRGVELGKTFLENPVKAPGYRLLTRISRKKEGKSPPRVRKNDILGEERPEREMTC